MTPLTRSTLLGSSSSLFRALGALICSFSLIALSSAIPKPSDCKGEGFYRNPDDCSRFYRCVPSFNGKFSVFHFSCSAGTVFDEKFGVCNYEWNTKSCSDNTGSGSSPIHSIVDGPSGSLGIPIRPEHQHPIFGSKPVPQGPQEVLIPLGPSHPHPLNPLEHPHQPIYPVGHANHPFDRPTNPVDQPNHPLDQPDQALDNPTHPLNHPSDLPHETQESNNDPGADEIQGQVGPVQLIPGHQGQIILPIPSRPVFEPAHPMDSFESHDDQQHFPSLPLRPISEKDPHFQNHPSHQGPNRPFHPQEDHDQHFSGYPPHPVDHHFPGQSNQPDHQHFPNHPSHQQGGQNFAGHPNHPQSFPQSQHGQGFIPPFPGVIHRPFRPFPGQPRPIQPRPIPGGHRPPFSGQHRPGQHRPGQGRPIRPFRPPPAHPTRPNRPFQPTPDSRPHRPIPGRPILGGSYPKPIGPIPETQKPIEQKPSDSAPIDTAENNQYPEVVDKPDSDSDGLPVGGSPGQMTNDYPELQPTNPGQYPPEYPSEPANDIDNILFPGQQLPEYQPEGYPDGFPLNPEPGFIVGKPPQIEDNNPIEVDANPEIFPGGPGDTFPDGEYVPDIGKPGQAPGGIDIEDGFPVNFPKPSFEDTDFPEVETDLIPATDEENDENDLNIEISDNPFTTPGSIVSSNENPGNQQNNNNIELVEGDSDSEEDISSANFSPNDKGFINLPHSVYQCEEPGFFGSQTGCHEFYVCQEVLPGKLLADQVYRCPDRYLFDDVTQRCQREEKVTCNKFSLGYEADSKENVLVVLEQYLNEFFGTPLKYAETRERFGISPINA